MDESEAEAKGINLHPPPSKLLWWYKKEYFVYYIEINMILIFLLQI